MNGVEVAQVTTAIAMDAVLEAGVIKLLRYQIRKSQ
jgi:hypothetical protein